MTTPAPLAPTPWSFWTPVAQWIFEILWGLLASWTPKPLNFWRLLLLRLFGCKVYGKPFVHPRACFTHPWKVTLHHRACLSDRAHAYALAPITLQAGCTVAQEAYLCAGTHDFTDPGLPLIPKPIVVGESTFVGARAFILPGVTLGANAVVGACAVVTKDVPNRAVVAGNPAKILKTL